LNDPILVIGVGGGGCTSVNHLRSLCDASTLTVNSDSSKGSFGVVLTASEVSACSDASPDLLASTPGGRALLDELSGHDAILVVAGLGGETGNVVAPAVLALAADLGLATASVASLPMKFETGRRDRAAGSLEKLMSIGDRTVLIDSDRISEEGEGDLKYDSIIQAVDEMTCEAIIRMADIMRGPFRTMMPDEAYTVGFAGGSDPVKASADAFSSLMSHDVIPQAKALVHIDGAITDSEREGIINAVSLITGEVPEVVAQGPQRDAVGVMVFNPISVRRVCRLCVMHLRGRP
jgi:cell division GTPase FtsZ